MFSERKILIVEDDRAEIDKIEFLLMELRADYKIAQSRAEASRCLKDESYDFLLTDLHIETKAGFERPDGLDIIELALEQQPNLIIVATSSDPRADIWNEALRAGAQHFIRKPLSRADELVIAFGLAKERKQLLSGLGKQDRKQGLWHSYHEKYPEGLVIDTMTLNKARGLAKRYTTPCVLFGETGTGKEEIAKLIHRFRCQAEGQIPFVAVNCATITAGLTESLLFGHKKGAFTGAEQTTNGYIGDADGGILFLDEIHTLDLACQQKLLRVLADGTYNRLGETRIYRSRFQLVAATTKDLDDEVDAGRFMLDLRGRITGLDIQLAPLRERKEDIPALVALFLAKKQIELDEKVFVSLCDRLQSFYWRGNIRQLFKVLDSWLLHCEFQELPLTAEHIPVFKGMLAPQSQETYVATKLPPVPERYRAAISEIIRGLSYDSDADECVSLYEKIFLESALERHKSISDCAKAINLPRSTLDAKRRKYGI